MLLHTELVVQAVLRAAPGTAPGTPVPSRPEASALTETTAQLVPGLAPWHSGGSQGSVSVEMTAVQAVP